jgi:hypothetical protein
MKNNITTLYIHDCTISGLSTGTAMKSGGVKLEFTYDVTMISLWFENKILTSYFHLVLFYTVYILSFVFSHYNKE